MTGVFFWLRTYVEVINKGANMNNKAIETVEVVIATCQRCGHRWQPRDVNRVRVCPKCKTPYWDTPKKEK